MRRTLFAGCQRVTGDEEEDGVDDLDNEFNWDGHDSQSVAESMLYGHMSYGRGGDPNGAPQAFQLNPNVPLLTNGQMVLLLPNPSITIRLPPPFVGYWCANGSIACFWSDCRWMTSHRSSTRWCLLSWVVGERGYIPFLMRIPAYLVCIWMIISQNIVVVMVP
jgi:hypothetical protein